MQKHALSFAEVRYPTYCRPRKRMLCVPSRAYLRGVIRAWRFESGKSAASGRRHVAPESPFAVFSRTRQLWGFVQFVLLSPSPRRMQSQQCSSALRIKLH